MFLVTIQQDNKKIPSHVNLESPSSIVSMLVAVGTSAETYTALTRKGVRPAVSAIAGTGLGLLAGSASALGVREIGERFTPRGGISNFVEGRYKRMWETRRKQYGPSGRKVA